MPKTHDAGGGSSKTQANQTSIAIAANYPSNGVGKRLQNHPLHPTMRPVPGLNGNSAYYRTGRIYGTSSSAGNGADNSKWAFQFQYNPASINITNSSNWDLNFDPTTPVNAIPNAAVVSWELLLNRIADVSDPDPKYYIPQGTLHDLEYLFRVVNGNPINMGEMGITSDLGMLVPTPVLVVFGSRLKYTGYITEIDVQHAMFQQDMVPVYTTVSISMSRNISGVNGGGGNNTVNPPVSPGNGSKTGGGYTGF